MCRDKELYLFQPLFFFYQIFETTKVTDAISIIKLIIFMLFKINWLFHPAVVKDKRLELVAIRKHDWLMSV